MTVKKDVQEKDDKRHLRGKSHREHFVITSGQKRLMTTYGPTELAKKSGLSRTLLYKIMQDESPEMSIVTIRKLARVFGMQDWEFLKLK